MCLLFCLQGLLSVCCNPTIGLQIRLKMEPGSILITTTGAVDFRVSRALVSDSTVWACVCVYVKGASRLDIKMVGFETPLGLEEPHRQRRTGRLLVNLQGIKRPKHIAPGILPGLQISSCGQSRQQPSLLVPAGGLAIEKGLYPGLSSYFVLTILALGSVFYFVLLLLD